MWKVLIKLVERLAYRCEHNWHLEEVKKVYLSDTSKYPIKSTKIYICKKCMKVKKVS